MVLDISKVRVQLRRAAAQKGKENTLPSAAVTAWESGLRYVGGYIGVSDTWRCRVSPVHPTCLQTMLVCQPSFITTYGQLSEGGPASFERFVFRKNIEWY